MTEREKPYRLIGPHNNRLVNVLDVEAHLPGQIDHRSAEILKTQGWKRYAGTAEAEDGWIKPDTDPNLKPRTSFKVDP